MNIEDLSPELQEEMRRAFPEEFIEQVPLHQSETSIVDTFSGFPNNDIQEIEDEVIEEIEEIEDYLEDTEDEEEEEVSQVDDSIVAGTSYSEPIGIIEEPLVESQYTRFKGADWFKTVQNQEIILAGLGGIGSYVNLFLSRLGPRRLYLFDDDLFESHNMSGQFVSRQDINKHKVNVAKQHSENFSNYTPVIYAQKYIKGACMTEKVMICGFDNMKARRDFYESWKESIIPGISHEYLFIDGRLLAEEWQIICITGEDAYSQDAYEKIYLFDDSVVQEVDCTLKQTSHFAGMIATQMVAYFVNFCNNLSSDNFPRRLPFYHHYNGILNTHEFKY